MREPPKEGKGIGELGFWESAVSEGMRSHSGREAGAWVCADCEAIQISPKTLRFEVMLGQPRCSVRGGGAMVMPWCMALAEYTPVLC